MINQPEVRERMFELIEQWQQSGLSQKAFCEQHSIRYYVFHYWYCKSPFYLGGAYNKFLWKFEINPIPSTSYPFKLLTTCLNFFKTRLVPFDIPLNLF